MSDRDNPAFVDVLVSDDLSLVACTVCGQVFHDPYFDPQKHQRECWGE